MTVADLGKQPSQVSAMFDAVARRYDLTNDVLSLGRTHAWRRATVAAVEARPGWRVLDVAAGTGSSTMPLARAGAEVVACDFSLGMMRAGRQRHPELPFVAGDATALPFPADRFDAVLISFGLRNVIDPEAALTEFRRVTRPGGRLVVCEFSAPTSPVIRTAYLEYLMRGLPGLARTVSSNPVAYEYLADSIRAWPDQRELADTIGRCGWSNVQWRNLTGGIVALHRAWNG